MKGSERSNDLSESVNRKDRCKIRRVTQRLDGMMTGTSDKKEKSFEKETNTIF